MNEDRIAGVLPVLAVPFAADWRIDAGQLAAEVDWVYTAGADGVVVAMVSEITRLSAAERKELGTLVCQFSAGRGPVVLSVGAESTPLAIDLARHAQESGAAALMANAPLAARPNAGGLIAHFSALVEAVDLPVVIQDASGYAGARLPAAVSATLFERYGPSRIFFKPEAVPLGPRLSELHALTDGKARIFEGSGGGALVESHRRGVAGTMPGPDLVWAIVALWRALEDSRIDAAYAISEALAPIIAMLPTLDAYVAVEKHLLVKQGVFSGARMRGPADFELDAVGCEHLDRLFNRLKSAAGRAAGDA